MASDRWTLKQAGVWFLASGVVVTIGATIGLTDPTYWAPVSSVDYTAAIVTSIGWLMIAAALFVLRRARPSYRGALWLMVAAAGFAVAAVGNFLEDIVGVEFGVWLFIVGLLTAAVAAVAAGVLAMAAKDSMRLSGLFLIAYVAGGVAPDIWGDFISAASLLGLGLFLFIRDPRAVTT